MSDGATVTICEANATDVAWLGWCTLRAYAPYVSVMGRKPIVMLDDFRALLAHDQVWVAQVQADRAGLLVLRREPESLCIHSIAVVPTQQGHGLGRRLLAFAHREAQLQGYERLTLMTNEHMRSNIEWYTRAGFQEVKRVLHLGSAIVHMQKYHPLPTLECQSAGPFASAPPVVASGPSPAASQRLIAVNAGSRDACNSPPSP